MPLRTRATHRITIAAPVDACMTFFSPAGEERWVSGWKPRYIAPEDGRTEKGMTFTTGTGDELTLWILADWDTSSHYARYARVTPASRMGFVEVQCTPIDHATTAVAVTYELTALTAAAEALLTEFEGEAYAAMIEEWKREIDAHLLTLLASPIR